MKDYPKIFLNTLIDKYERSTLYRGDNKQKVTIAYKFNQRNIPEYFNEINYQNKEKIHEVVRNLALHGYIEIVWKKYEAGNILKQINLNLNRLADIYQLLNREEKGDKEREAIKVLATYLDRKNLLSVFAQDMIKQLNTGKSIAKYLDINNLSLIKAILYSIDRILNQQEEISQRVFGIDLFNDSKYFATIENKIIKIMMDYGNYIDEENLLAEENIVHNPGYVFLKGKGILKCGETEINLQALNGEIALSSKIIKTIEVKELDVDKVITIENLTTFHTYQKDNELIIYLGGFHNQLREDFLLKLYHYNQNNPFYHWSDIDLGGFRIFHHLKSKTKIPFKPYNMNKEILIKYQQYAMEINSNAYLKALKSLLNNEDYKIFYDVISYMIEKKVRLEQEIIIE